MKGGLNSFTDLITWPGLSPHLAWISSAYPMCLKFSNLLAFTHDTLHIMQVNHKKPIIKAGIIRENWLGIWVDRDTALNKRNGSRTDSWYNICPILVSNISYRMWNKIRYVKQNKVSDEEKIGRTDGRMIYYLSGGVRAVWFMVHHPIHSTAHPSAQPKGPKLFL